MASPDDNNVIANACESKPYNVTRNAKLRDTFWVKGQPYSVLDMLGHDELASQFAGATVYQAFLSALSYHRWHSPVSGTVKRAFVQDGTYFSLPLCYDQTKQSQQQQNGNAVKGGTTTEGKTNESEIDASLGAISIDIDRHGITVAQGYLTALATRAIIFIEADNPAIGLMAFIGVGMDEVSTCDITVQEGQHINKGDDLGMFHFGGSTHCLLFRKDVRVEEFPEVGREENVPVRGRLAVVRS